MAKLEVTLEINHLNFSHILVFDMLAWLMGVKSKFSVEDFLAQRDDFENMLNACKAYCAQETKDHYKSECQKRISIVEDWYQNRLKLVSERLKLEAEKLAWKLLPQGELDFEQLNSAIISSRVDRVVGFERLRLEYAHSLLANKIYVGQDEFKGYFVFLYPWTKKVLLENPFSGNAAYIISDSWQQLSRLSKKQLLGLHQKKITRIIHTRGSNTWKTKLKNALTEGRYE